MKVNHTVDNSKLFEILIKDLGKAQLKVGWNENERYDDGESVAGIAAQNEFGNPMRSIPPRPFMRPAMQTNRIKWAKVAAQETKKMLNNTSNIPQSLNILGLVVQGDIAKAIQEVTSPPLKESTIRARLRGKKQGKSVSLSIAKPLVDTGHMLQTITSEIQE